MFVTLQETDESLSFDEMILEAAKSIAAATSALVKAASAAQRELIDIGKVNISSANNVIWIALLNNYVAIYRSVAVHIRTLMTANGQKVWFRPLVLWPRPRTV